ncbi:hypothetical protein CROQUDRAFT_653635 [Cronartium quercuum f. sp. fusiforme G11]|uniref:Bola-like protein n=1 Tax=Cronartium quercuum f. sp. fusiforme G11 TaxID=708437 RepID=A0A9P6NSB6_9BASI|nr:hypothetical protein CROQUDRAFT_653635 [Cronartium quercuum f. sp. fusiforme G11]
MPVSQESLQKKLDEAFPGSLKRQVFDISGGCGQSYEVLIVSDEFKGKGLLAKHRLVNERLKEEIAELHAFSQKTFTPEQFAALENPTQA